MRRRWGVGAGRVVLVMVAAGAAAPAGAQVEVGVKGGLSSTTIDWSTTPLGTGLDRLERRNGLTAGATLAVPGPGRLGFRFEALHTAKGFTEVQPNGASTRLELSYLELPLLAAYALTPPTSAWVPEVYAGPWLAFESACTAGGREGAVELEFDCNDVPDGAVERETTDWGVAVGLAVRRSLTDAARLTVDGRWSPGLRNVDATEEIDNIQAHHRGFSATVGLSWTVAR